jgi:integrase
MPAAAEKVLLTDKFLKSLKPAADRRRTIWDTEPGLAVQVGKKGRPTFFAVARKRGDAQPTWRKLGEYNAMSLEKAREAVRDALKAFKDGKDPKKLAAEKQKAEDEAERERMDNTFAAVAERFNAWYAATPSKKTGRLRKTAPHVAATIARELTPVWGTRPVADITEKDVAHLMGGILKRGEPGSTRRDGGANTTRHAFQAASLLFDWARKVARLIKIDPTAGIEPGDVHGKATTRDRVLKEEELRRVWHAAEATEYPYGPLIRLLTLTGARRDELAAARWSEIEDNVLVVPAARMKGGVSHTIPLTATAMTILNDLPRFNGDFIFSTTGGRRPISGFSKARTKFERALGEMAHWTLHDLRRTCRTGLSSLGVLPVVAELVIGHKQTGIAAVYDLHRYDAEKREALEDWEAKLLSIVDPRVPAPGKVVSLRARKRA